MNSGMCMLHACRKACHGRLAYRSSWSSNAVQCWQQHLHFLLRRHLREHQRAGVKFLWECTMGLREANRFGAVLADEMGLGCALAPRSLQHLPTCISDDDNLSKLIVSKRWIQ